MGLYNKMLILVILLVSCESGNVRQAGFRVPERYGASEYSELSDDAKQRYLREYYLFPDIVIDKIIKGEVFIGMTTEQALFSWGRPDKIDKRSGSWGVVEKWSYSVDAQGSAFKYLHFKDERLDDWKE
jgi:tricorn protease-like protein